MTDKNQHHYFATHALGYAKAETREAAIENLLQQNTDPAWVRNCLKDGNPLIIWTCKVNVPVDEGYGILSYQPKADWSDGENYIVTYLTKTKHAVCRDANDEVRKLEAQLKERNDQLRTLAYAAAKIETPPAFLTDLLKPLFEDEELFPKGDKEEAA